MPPQISISKMAQLDCPEDTPRLSTAPKEVLGQALLEQRILRSHVGCYYR